MDKAETQKYVQQLQAEIREKDELIGSLRAENKKLKMKAIDMEFSMHNPDGAIYKSVKEEAKMDAAQTAPGNLPSELMKATDWLLGRKRNYRFTVEFWGNNGESETKA